MVWFLAFVVIKITWSQQLFLSSSLFFFFFSFRRSFQLVFSVRQTLEDANYLPIREHCSVEARLETSVTGNCFPPPPVVIKRGIPKLLMSLDSSLACYITPQHNYTPLNSASSKFSGRRVADEIERERANKIKFHTSLTDSKGGLNYDWFALKIQWYHMKLSHKQLAATKLNLGNKEEREARENENKQNKM